MEKVKKKYLISEEIDEWAEKNINPQYERLKKLNAKRKFIYSNNTESLYANLITAIKDCYNFMLKKQLNYKEFCDDVDKINNTQNYPFHKDKILFGFTPEILSAMGYQELPIYMTSEHLYTCIKENGFIQGDNIHYHNLSADLIKTLPFLLPNTFLIAKSNTYPDNLISFIDYPIKDINGKDVPLLTIYNPSGSISFERIKLQSNKLTSIYGKDDVQKWLNNFDLSQILYLNKKISQQYQLTTPLDNSVAGLVQPSGFYINNINQYIQKVNFIQNNRKLVPNTKEILLANKAIASDADFDINAILHEPMIPNFTQITPTISEEVNNFEQKQAGILDIVGKRIDVDEKGTPTFEGMKAISRAMEIYSDKHYETARYLFIRDGQIIRHVTVSSQTPSSTTIKPDEKFLYSLRTYAENTGSKIVFLHNHPSGYVEPSKADIKLTNYLANFFTRNGESLFSGHIILDHGTYGLYTEKTREWGALINGELKPLSQLRANIGISFPADTKIASFNPDFSISTQSLIELSEYAKECDDVGTWNTKDWVPCLLLSSNGIVTNFDVIKNHEFENINILSNKLKQLGREFGSENIILFPRTPKQFLITERFAQLTRKIKDIYFEKDDGTFELSQFPNGNIFNDLTRGDIKIVDSENYEEEVKIKIGTLNNNFDKAKHNLIDFIKNKKYLRESEISQKEAVSLFDKELYLFNNGQLDENHVFNLGKPGEILKNCGFPENDRIELVVSRLKIKATQGNHPFEIMDILGLDKALQNPIAVFEYGEKEKAQNVIVNLKKDGKNFLVDVFFNQKKDGFEVSSIRGLFNRDNLDWMRWIQQGKMIYGDKERIQVLANQQRTNLADVNSKEARTLSDLYYLDSLDKILQNFVDVKNVYTRDFPKYTEQKEKFEIFKQFRSAYQEIDSINIYDAAKDTDEFYKAIKNNDKSIIEKFTNGIEKPELASVASLILQNRGSHAQLKGINAQALNPDLQQNSESVKQKENLVIEPKPKLKTYHKLKKEEIDGLKEITQEEFNSIIDALYQQPNPDYKEIPPVIKLPQINKEIAQKLGVENANFFMRSEIAHVRPQRKGNYDQALRIEEMKGMLDFIKTCKTAYIDNNEKHQNFMLAGLDEQDDKKSNKIVFNKDEYGNYIVTVGKVDTFNLEESKYSKVAVGVEPTIWMEIKSPSIATMLRSSTTSLNENIQRNSESVKQELKENKIMENENTVESISSLQSALKNALKEVAIPLEKIEFTRDNYNKLFPYSKIETPIESVKMGEHQFEKLEAKQREFILQATHDTLSNPDLIINEQKENVFGEQEDSHLYAKSFFINDKVHGVQSVVVSIDGENVSISTHERDINNFVNKIKKPDQLLYAAAKVRLLVERATGKQLVTVNPTREFEYVKSLDSNLQQKSESVKQDLKENKIMENEQIDNDMEQLQVNYELSEKGIENSYYAKQNSKSDYLDENGNPHLYSDEENEIDEGISDEELIQIYKQKYPDSSLNISENTRKELENVFSEIDDYLDKGTVPKERRFTLPKTPFYLQELGSDETVISLPVSVIKKAKETHGLSNEEIKNSLLRFYDPVVVFDTDKTKSENKQNSKVILTDEFAENKPIALAINTNSHIQVQENAHRKFIEVQDIRSIHDRTLIAKNGTDLINQWTENGLCRYVDDKKISDWSTVARVYFPIEALQSDKNNILIKSEIVNSQESEKENKLTKEQAAKAVSLVSRQGFSQNNQEEIAIMFNKLKSVNSIAQKNNEPVSVLDFENPILISEAQIFDFDKNITEENKSKINKLPYAVITVPDKDIEEGEEQTFHQEKYYLLDSLPNKDVILNQKQENKIDLSKVIVFDTETTGVKAEEELRKELAAAKKQIKALEKKLEETLGQNNSLQRENSAIKDATPAKDNTPAKENQAVSKANQIQDSPGRRRNNEIDTKNFSSENAYTANTPVPKFGLKNKDGKIRIIDGAVFKKQILDEKDPAANKIVLELQKEDGTSEDVEISEFKYQNIINGVERLNKFKEEMGNKQTFGDWFKAHEDYNQALLLDEFKLRENTAGNFIHNFKARCLLDARNRDEAIKIAARMVKDMNHKERNRFNKDRKEKGTEEFDNLLINIFDETHAQKQLAIKDVDIFYDVSLSNNSLERGLADENRDLNEMKTGDLIPGCEKFKVGDTVPISITTKGFDGKQRKTPKADFKIARVSKNVNPPRALLFNEKTKAVYLMSLVDLKEHLKKIERSQLKERRKTAERDYKQAGYDGPGY